jgi:hypothetical protein
MMVHIRSEEVMKVKVVGAANAELCHCMEAQGVSDLQT